MEFRPTPPQPMTTTLEPALTLAVLTTAPMPVSTPQAISEALSSLHVLGDGDRLRRVEHHALGESAGAQAVDDRLARPVMQGRLPVKRENLLAEDRRALRRRRRKSRKTRMRVATTWSPGFRRVTPGPTASTTPAASWP